MDRIDEIMAVVCELCQLDNGMKCPPKDHDPEYCDALKMATDKITAILAKPEVIECEGREWTAVKWDTAMPFGTVSYDDDGCTYSWTAYSKKM